MLYTGFVMSVLTDFFNHTAICSICLREDKEYWTADYTCFICDKPMCFSHSNNHETEGKFCDDCFAE